MAIMHRSNAKAGISETRVCAWKRAVVALAVAISLVFLPVVARPQWRKTARLRSRNPMPLVTLHPRTGH